MNTEPHDEAHPPAARITLTAETVLLRAELAHHRDERQAGLDRLARIWQPTADDLRDADERHALALDAYTTARLQHTEDLAVLNRAVALTDQAIALLEHPAAPLTPHLAPTLEQLHAATLDPDTYRELEPPLDALALLLAEAALTDP